MKKLILALITLTVMAAIGCVRLPAADTNVIYVSDDTVETEAVSAGTGFFVTDNGVIVTSAHVIEDVDKITVVINDIEYPAEVLQRDEENDLAVLKINYNNSYHFKIVNFEPIHPGDRLSALGFPFALHDDFITSEPRFTEGTLSAKTGLRSMQASFQHSVPTQPGNSGGPLFNNRNEVVGVVFARADASLNPQNVNFGIRSDNIFPLLNKSNIRPGNGNIRNNTDAQNAVVLILGYLVEANDGPPVTIVNNTGYLVYYLYISPTISNRWGADRLASNQTLPNGQSVTVSLPHPLNTTNKYDIRLTDLDGDTYTKANITVAANDRIVFTFDDFD